MPRFQFVDKRPEHSPRGYATTNEHLPTLREFASKANPIKAGGISSGGEVPLTVLLPLAGKVVAVDHSYHSLWWAWLKASMLEHMPESDLRALFLRPSTYANDMAKEITQDMPVGLRSNKETVGHTLWENICGIWGGLPDGFLDLIRERLNLLTFVHGDLRDLSDWGRDFNLVYVSNAMQFSGHDGKVVGPSVLSPLMFNGTYLLHTSVGTGFLPKPWKRVASTHQLGGKQRGDMGWGYCLDVREDDTSPTP